MTEYEEKLDELIADQVGVEQAIGELMLYQAQTSLAQGESNNQSKEALVVREAFAEALELDVSLNFLPDLRVDLIQAQEHAGRLNIELDQLYINADLVDSLFYLRPQKPDILAIRIESALFQRVDRQMSQTYFDNFILLESAVRHPENAVLRGRLIFGILHPIEFVSMAKHELEPYSEQILRDLAREAILASKDLGRYVVETGIQCVKCAKKTVTRQEKQSRSADEPMSIFYTCSSCGYKWTVN